MDILRSVKNVSPFLRTEFTCHNIKWLIPKLVRQMETSDSEQLQLVAVALVAIFQNFVKIKETNHDHLKLLREMVVDAAVRVLRFYYSKGDTFEIEESYLAVITALSYRCRQALLDIVLEAARENFFSVKPKVAQIYVNALYLVMPAQTEEIFMKWIHDRVITPCDPPAKWGNLLSFRYLCFWAVSKTKWNRRNRIPTKRNK